MLEDTPLQRAMMERGVYSGPLTLRMSGDEFVARLADLPLAFQPGEGWLYDTGINLLGVLLTRATGRPLSELVAERITGPLVMGSTSFGVAMSSGWRPPTGPRGSGLELSGPAGRRLRAPARVRGAERRAGIDGARCTALLLRHGGRRGSRC